MHTLPFESLYQHWCLTVPCVGVCAYTSGVFMTVLTRETLCRVRVVSVWDREMKCAFYYGKDKQTGKIVAPVYETSGEVWDHLYDTMGPFVYAGAPFNA